MRQLAGDQERLWREGEYFGDSRAVVRATVQKPMMRLHHWGMTSTFTRLTPSFTGTSDILSTPTIDPLKPSRVKNTYADFLFNPQGRPKELFNIASLEWERTVDTDTATATLALWNTAPLEPGDRPEGKDLDRQGHYTWDHGTAYFANQWGHLKNEWAGYLMPDNIIRTYQGYGSDYKTPPERDERVTLTGTWLIDDVQMSNDGQGVPTLILRCRDMMRLMMDHIAFPPVVPDDFYPVSFDNWDYAFRTGTQTVQVGSKDTGKLNWAEAKPIRQEVYRSSNRFWYEPNDEGRNDPQASINGHRPRDAGDGNTSTYWLSIDNSSPSRGFSYEHLDIKTFKKHVDGLKFRTVKSGYTAYLSVKVNGRWINGPSGKPIPYNDERVGKNQSNIPFISSTVVRSEDWHFLECNHDNVEEVRLTLGGLQKFEKGRYGVWRAAVREVQAVAGPNQFQGVYEEQPINTKLKPGPTGSNPGRAQDVTDIIKLFAAWAGFYWPSGAKRIDCDGRVNRVGPKDFDTETLGAPVRGRVWGDFESFGTMTASKLGEQDFDKKSLLDGLAELRELSGYLFFCDESGAIQWRQPNIYRLGNLFTGQDKTPGRTNLLITLDERETLMNITSTLSSKNVREAVFAGSKSAEVAGVAAGWNPNYVGLRRFGGYTDSNWENEAEAQRWADMTTVRQLFAYRTDTVTIPGYPGIQIDDQVRIVERVTAEGYVHYVKGISSSHDARTGEWTYTLQTHWLGDRVGNRWVLDRKKLSRITQAQIERALARNPVETKRGEVTGA